MQRRPSRSVFVCLALVLFAALQGCGQRRSGDGPIVVAVSIPPLAQFVERIGGDHVRPIVMVPPGANPHVYEPRPAQLAGVSEAALYIKVGSGIEFELAWFDRIRSVNREMLVVDASEGVRTDGGDPHIWVSPRNAVVMARNVCRGLVVVDPRRRAYYESNRDAFEGELEAIDTMLARALHGAEGREFLVYHPAWAHLARDYGLVQVPIETDGKEPTARGIERIVETARRRGITVVFASPQFNTKAASIVAGEIGGSVVMIDPLERDYTGGLRRAAKALAEAIQGQRPAEGKPNP